MRTCPTCGGSFPDAVKFCPEDGTALPPPVVQDPLLGVLLDGRYRLEERLGEGGMGAVYRGVHTLMNRPVAVKILRPELSARADLVKRFHREASLTSRLDHESCVRVMDVSPEGSARLYLVMELLQGGDVAHALRKGPLSPRRTVEIAAAVASALAHAHEQGVIHRDLKPENVYLHRRGAREVVKVVDFGIARSDYEETITRAGEVFGTPEFMSPEQVNDPASVDPRSDLYSLAATMFAMLTGRPPVADASPVKILTLVVTGAVERSPRKLAPAVPEWLDRLVARCLSLAPAGRPASAAEVEAELVRGLESMPPDAAPSSGDRDTGPRLRRRSIPQSPMAATLAASSGGTMLGPLSERRQLTVMVGELSSLAELTERLEVDDLREVLLAFRDACEEVIHHYGGRVTRAIDHGMLAYLGYPKAHEDDAARAVAAALAIVRTVAALHPVTSTGERLDLAVSVGLHSGQVLVEDESGPEGVALVGMPPSVAARLAREAGPNEVVASGATYALLQGAFRCQARRHATIPGLSQPVATYQVIEEQAFGSRFERNVSAGLAPLVGRRREIDMLGDLWAQAREGSGQVVLLLGEAGLGKSRVVQELKDRLGEAEHVLVEMQCWEHAQTSALYPIIQLLERLSGFLPADTAETRHDKLEALVASLGMDVATTAPLLAALLSLRDVGRYPAVEVGGPRRKAETFAALLSLLMRMAERRPVLLVIEDLHWVDPSTLELCDLVAEHAPGARILFVATLRPEAELALAGKSHVVKLPLARLAPVEVRALLAGVAQKPLPPELVEHLLRTSDGIPLFAEESAKMMLESGVLADGGERYTLAGRLPAAAAPATLQDSLMARLDRLPTAKDTAQRASVIGREFTFALLRAITPEGGALAAELKRLVDAGLLLQKGLLPESTYQFKHALIRDTAYRSLPRRRQQQIHQEVAIALTRDFPALVEAQPEVVAAHYAEAGLHAASLGYWVRAGQRAFDGFAHVEATAHFRRALELLALLPPSAERDQKERGIQLALGVSLMATQGYAGPDVVRAYERVRELADRGGDAREQFSALRGTWLYYSARGAFDTAAELIPPMRTLAEDMGDRTMILQALYPAGVNGFHRGDLAAAESDLERALSLYDREEQRRIQQRYGVVDPAVGSLCYVGAIRWLRGERALGLAKSEEAERLARDLQQPFSMAYASFGLAWMHQLDGDVDLARTWASRTLEVATKERYRFWLGLGSIVAAWAKARQGGADGLDAMIQALTGYRAAGAALLRTPQVAAAAELCAEAGRVEQGLELVAEGLDVGVGRGERFFRAELVRVQGELLRAKGDEAGAVAAFFAARDEAQRRGALSLELRAATSLAALDPTRGAAELAAIVARFGEAERGADLLRAREIVTRSADS